MQRYQGCRLSRCVTPDAILCVLMFRAFFDSMGRRFDRGRVYNRDLGFLLTLQSALGVMLMLQDSSLETLQE